MKSTAQQQSTIRQNPQAAFKHALDLMQARQLNKAVTFCEQIVAAVPSFANAWLLLCQLHLDSQRPERAMSCVDKVLVLEASNRKALMLRAECLLAVGRIAEAKAALNALESESQQDALLLRLVGNIYAGGVFYDDACRCFERALQLNVDDIECWHLYSGVLFAQGLLEPAEQALNEVLRLEPHHGEALLTRSSMRKQLPDRNHVHELRSLLAKASLDPEGAVVCAYALAKELEDLGEYEKAFEILKRGADENDARLKYSVKQEVGFIEQLTGICRQKISGPGDRDTRGEGLVFVVSLPRAGSTLVDRIIGSHSRAESLGETAAFHDSLLQHARRASAANKMTFIEALTCVDYAAVADTYLAKLNKYASRAALLIDKTPNNVLYLGLIHKALPKARIIHVRKNPMDACYSIYRTYFNRGYAFSYDLDKLGEYFVAYHRMMDFWRQQLPGAFIDLDYEQLVCDQEAQTRRLLAYCGLDWEQNCMDFHLNRNPTATASVVQVRQPMFKSSLDQWRRYERQLGPLAAMLQDAGIDISPR